MIGQYLLNIRVNTVPRFASNHPPLAGHPRTRRSFEAGLSGMRRVAARAPLARGGWPWPMSSLPAPSPRVVCHFWEVEACSAGGSVALALRCAGCLPNGPAMRGRWWWAGKGACRRKTETMSDGGRRATPARASGRKSSARLTLPQKLTKFNCDMGRLWIFDCVRFSPLFFFRQRQSNERRSRVQKRVTVNLRPYKLRSLDVGVALV